MLSEHATYWQRHLHPFNATTLHIIKNLRSLTSTLVLIWMSDIQIHFGYSVTSKLNQLTSNFKTSGCQTSSMNFGIGCPHSLEMELDVQFKPFQKWMSDILDVTFRQWMSAISKMDVTFQNGCHCDTFQK